MPITLTLEPLARYEKELKSISKQIAKLGSNAMVKAMLHRTTKGE